jgi:hypothetical protein
MQFAPRNSNTFADPRSHIVFDDAKTFFSTHNAQYDIIVSEPSNPWVSGVSSLFTAEFYHHVRRYLRPGGVLVQWFQLYEIDMSLVASVLQALGEEFPDYAVYAATNSDLLIVAGDPQTLAQPLADVFQIPGVARELHRIGFHAMDDLRIRRIGSRAALAPLFASYGVPANSDYEPYLDLHAAKDRFLQQSAGELTALGVAPVPAVAMLEGRVDRATPDPSIDSEEYLQKSEYIRRARYARDFLLRSLPPQPWSIPRQMEKDLELARTRLLDCREPDRYDIWLHALYQLARDVNPMLGPDDAGAVWTRFELAPCNASIASDQRAWMTLFKAVSRRDAEAMAALGEGLLARSSDLPQGHRQYLLAVAMTGYLAQGQRDRAAALWSRYPDDADAAGDLNLRLLYAHAFAK